MIKEITVKELEQLQKGGEDFQLIDVREPNEFEADNLEGELIPLGSIPQSVEKISKDKKVVIHCRSGARSAQAIQYLQSNFDYENLFNLKGGILAYRNEIG